MTAFSRTHPEVEVAFQADFGESDLVAEGLDISIRIAKVLKDSNCIACPLTTAPQQLVASADYLRKFGTPTSVGDLARHNCLIHAFKAPTSQWAWTHPGPGPPQRNQPIRVRTYLEFLQDWFRTPRWEGPVGTP